MLPTRAAEGGVLITEPQLWCYGSVGFSVLSERVVPCRRCRHVDIACRSERMRCFIHASSNVMKGSWCLMNRQFRLTLPCADNEGTVLACLAYSNPPLLKQALLTWLRGFRGEKVERTGKEVAWKDQRYSFVKFGKLGI